MVSSGQSSSRKPFAMPFRFLDLVPEIRERIYKLVCESPTPFISISPTHFRSHTALPRSLLLTNSQIYHEIRPLYFSHNCFSITVTKKNDQWDYFLDPKFQDNRRKIHHLRIVFLRWGSKGFWADILAPLIEDCILNGRLRRLEVFVPTLSQQRLQGHNFVLLKKLLRDPYVEQARLFAPKVLSVEEEEARKKRFLQSGTLDQSEFLPLECINKLPSGSFDWVFEDVTHRLDDVQVEDS